MNKRDAFTYMESVAHSDSLYKNVLYAIAIASTVSKNIAKSKLAKMAGVHTRTLQLAMDTLKTKGYIQYEKKPSGVVWIDICKSLPQEIARKNKGKKDKHLCTVFSIQTKSRINTFGFGDDEIDNDELDESIESMKVTEDRHFCDFNKNLHSINMQGPLSSNLDSSNKEDKERSGISSFSEEEYNTKKPPHTPPFDGKNSTIDNADQVRVQSSIPGFGGPDVTVVHPADEIKTCFEKFFWAHYRNKRNKPAALKAFTAAWRKNRLPKMEDLADDVKRRFLNPNWTKNKFKFSPHGSTYLNNNGWDEEFEDQEQVFVPADSENRKMAKLDEAKRQERDRIRDMISSEVD